MAMTSGTLKCKICGEPYKWYSHLVADQTVCPSCERKARMNTYLPPVYPG